MTIKKQFYILISLVVTASLLLMTVNQLNTQEIIKHSNQRIALGEIKSSMLELRKHEKDFFARKDLKYVDKFANTYSEIAHKAAQLNLNLSSHGMEIEEAQVVVEQLAQYNDLFMQSVDVQKKIGLHAKDGLYGTLRSSVHSAEELLKDKNAYRLTSDMLMLRRNEKDFMLRENTKYIDKFEKNIAVFQTSLVQSQFSASLKDQVRKAIDDYARDFNLLTQSYKEKGLTKDSGLVGKLRSAVHQVEEELVVLETHTIDEIVAADKKGEQINYILSTLLLLVILGLMLYISRSIRKPIDAFSKTIEKISQSKDLTVRSEINTKNEIGRMAASFNQMIGEIQGVLQGAIDSSVKVAHSADTMLSAMNKTSSYIEQQQQDNQNISQSISNILSTTSAVANDATKAESMSQEANVITDKQGVLTSSSIEEVRQLATEIENTATVISELEQESVNISLVLNVITDVSEQTNLLALNAAIEAARAGDQGRGFSVVADEVRLLAQRSQSSTEQIRTIIEKLQQKANLVSVAMQAGSRKMTDSLKSSEEAGESFQSISHFANNIRSLNKDIADAALRQTGFAEQVNENVEKVFQSTHLSVDEISQSAKLSKELNLLSRNLHQQVSAFKVA
jgi:methyl-accepting chemotaxis protein